ncbi:hypothetical protein Taro_048509 [Colocasia esculenta]|uniref:Uncharacterized protein n=1 Tax=Colocasia esculenta TaxID=4460 RepID=A0A843X8B3_COLES|nr:hypothetical protein [Colocasia esculenta]
MSFTNCWGRVEELLVAGELWIDHKKLIFFLFSSASSCANRPLGVDQRYKRCMSRTPVFLHFGRFRSAARNTSDPMDAFQASGVAPLLGDATI